MITEDSQLLRDDIERDLLTVGDLIFETFQPPENLSVDFKMLKKVLLIFANHLQMLDHDVELRFGPMEEEEESETEMTIPIEKSKDKKQRDRGKKRKLIPEKEKADDIEGDGKSDATPKKASPKTKKFMKDPSNFDDVPIFENIKKRRFAIRQKPIYLESIAEIDDSSTEEVIEERDVENSSKNKKKYTKVPSNLDDVPLESIKKSRFTIRQKPNYLKSIPEIEDSSTEEVIEEPVDSDRKHINANRLKPLKNKDSFKLTDNEAKKIKTSQQLNKKNEYISGIDSRATVKDEKVKKEKFKIPKAESTKKGGAGSVEVVTLKQFRKLARTVHELRKATKPIAMPTVPSDEALIKDVLDKKTTIPVAIEIIQLKNRVEAAEEMVIRMTDLFDLLILNGILPDKAMDLVKEGRALMNIPSTIITDDNDRKESCGKKRLEYYEHLKKRVEIIPVTNKQMHKALHNVLMSTKNDINEISKVAQFAVQIQLKITEISEKRDNHIIRLRERENEIKHEIEKAIDLTNDTKKFLEGKYAKLSKVTEIIDDMCSEMANIFELALQNPETVVIANLTQKFDGLRAILEKATYKNVLQREEIKKKKKTFEEYNFILKALQSMRISKANHVDFEALIDTKADKFLLCKTIQISDFDNLKRHLKTEYSYCLKKYNRQRRKCEQWLNEFRALIAEKCQMYQFVAVQQELVSALMSVEEMLKCLEFIVGEAEMAIKIREMSKDAFCASCCLPAKMNIEIDNKIRHSQELEDECLDMFKPPFHYRDRGVMRWVGGSHTLVKGRGLGGRVMNSENCCSRIHKKLCRCRTIPELNEDGCNCEST